MSRIKAACPQEKLEKMIKDTQNEAKDTGGFLKSYKAFLQQWGSYKEANIPKSKLDKQGTSAFKARLAHNE